MKKYDLIGCFTALQQQRSLAWPDNLFDAMDNVDKTSMINWTESRNVILGMERDLK